MLYVGFEFWSHFSKRWMEIQSLFLNQKDIGSLLLSDLYFSPLHYFKSYLATSLLFSQPFKNSCQDKNMVKTLLLIPMTYESEGLLIHAKNAVKYSGLQKMH